MGVIDVVAAVSCCVSDFGIAGVSWGSPVVRLFRHGQFGVISTVLGNRGYVKLGVDRDVFLGALVEADVVDAFCTLLCVPTKRNMI